MNANATSLKRGTVVSVAGRVVDIQFPQHLPPIFSLLHDKKRYCMYYIVESKKLFSQVSTDLETAVKRNGFGILYVHDLGDTLRSKGVEFDNQCKIFEVCNPGQAANVMATDMRLNMALPCRISVYTEQGQTRIGLIKPAQMLSALSSDASLAKVAEDVEDVEDKVMQMVDEAR